MQGLGLGMGHFRHHRCGGSRQCQRLLQGADLALQFAELCIEGRVFLIERHARLRLLHIGLGRASGHGRRGAAHRCRALLHRSRRRGRDGRRHEHARRTHEALGARAGRQRGGVGRRRDGYRTW
ncbi:hypothetical protein D3C81_1311730 [compost metagenome]